MASGHLLKVPLKGYWPDFYNNQASLSRSDSSCIEFMTASAMKSTEYVTSRNNCPNGMNHCRHGSISNAIQSKNVEIMECVFRVAADL